MRKFFKEKS